MRTTIALDDDVIKKIRERIKESHQPARKVYNELLRAALTNKPQKKNKERFHLITFKGENGLMPGYSWEMSTSGMLNKLDEEDWKGKNGPP
jgi:hypothetical protein